MANVIRVTGRITSGQASQQRPASQAGEWEQLLPFKELQLALASWAIAETTFEEQVQVLFMVLSQGEEPLFMDGQPLDEQEQHVLYAQSFSHHQVHLVAQSEGHHA